MDKRPRLYDIDASQFLLCLFEHYHEGVLIADHNGILIYYNKVLAKLDGLDHHDVIGRSITEIYQLEPTQSMTLNALRLVRPLINCNHIYRTVDGKLVNSISSSYPLFDKNMLVGAVCVVSDYSMLMDNYSKTNPQALKNPPGGKAEKTDVISFDNLIGRDENMMAAVDMAKKAAMTPSSVMLIGETGTGKELFAKAIHYNSPRKAGPFVAINCAAIPYTLLEAILFGTAKGAFTGALDKAGLFELANGGALFLDELNSMPLELQPKLLRALQDRQVRRIGSSGEIPIDIKIISAVNDSPFEAIERGALRADLFYRLGVVMVHLPPLRERRSDITRLLSHFVKKFNKLLGKNIQSFTPEALSFLQAYPWPGNVREMEHAIEATLNLAEIHEIAISLKHLQTALPLMKFGLSPPAPPPPAPPAPGLEDDFTQEAANLSEVLRKSRGNVAKAARLLGYSPQKLHYRLKKLGLNRADYKIST
ncbi:MAG: sigma 54-interacting transcriptional regulator [Candidatus Adiutrix sp.]|jgi:arginine utilization regulatory protein|nr:sigma 54-interacting transcriptional regulator [Candidatus Adiutrix sp.]